MSTPCIYAIRNRFNKHVYFGSTTHYEQRISQHLSKLRRNKHDSIHLQRAWNEYGTDAFYYHIVEWVSADQLAETEQWYIDSVPKELLYNCNFVAYRPPDCTGRTLTPEHRKAIGDSLRGKTQDPEFAKRRTAKCGRHKRTPEMCQAIRVRQSGKVTSEETRHKMSEAHTNKTHSQEAKDKCRAVANARWERWRAEGRTNNLSEEGRAAIGRSSATRTTSDETRRKLSESAKARHQVSGPKFGL